MPSEVAFLRAAVYNNRAERVWGIFMACTESAPKKFIRFLLVSISMFMLINIFSCTSKFNRDESLDSESNSVLTNSQLIKEWHHLLQVNGFSNVDSFSSSEQRVAMNDNGQAIIIWTQDQGPNSGLYKAERAINGTWTMPTSLADKISLDAGTGSPGSPQVSMNSFGEAVVTWTQSDGQNEQIFKAERAVDGTWTIPLNITDNISPDGQNTNAPQVAINSNGEAIISWQQFDGAFTQIYKAERSSSGTWTLPLNLADNISVDGQTADYLSQVVINDNSEAIITWAQSDGANNQIFKAERASNGTWTLPLNIADNISVDGNNCNTPKLAINSNSQAIITWEQTDGTHSRIFKAERASNGTWTIPLNIADNISFNGSGGFEPKVVLNENDEAIITWHQGDGLFSQIFKAERASNGTWSLPSSLADNISPTLQHAYSPEIALNDNGKAIIVWYQNDGIKNQIFKAERASNGTWTVPASLADNITIDTGDASFPRVAMNTNGESIITWSQHDGSNAQIFKAERASNGTWTLPLTLEENISPKGQSVGYTQLAVNSNGEAIITWTQSDGTKTQIFKAERSSSGTWSIPSSLTDNISPDSQDASYSQVAINSHGEAIIIWDQSDGANNRLYKAERAASGTWTVPTNLADAVSLAGSDVDDKIHVKINDSSEAIIAWVASDGSNAQIFKAERASNGSWTLPANPNDNISPNGTEAGQPKIALNNNGEGIIVWTQSDGTNDQIFKAERASNGTWTLPANTGDNLAVDGTDVSRDLQAVINENGDAVIAWTQNDGANSQLFKAERTAVGAWTVPANIGETLSIAGQDAVDPQLAINENGEAIISWFQSDGISFQVFKAERSDVGAWTYPSSLADSISINGYPAGRTKVSLNERGEAIIFWVQYTETSLQFIHADRSSDGVWILPTLNDGIFSSSDGVILSDLTDVFLLDTGEVIFGYGTSTHGVAVSEFR